MKTLFILLVFFSLAFSVKVINTKENFKGKNKKNVQLIFSKMYKHKFNTF